MNKFVDEKWAMDKWVDKLFKGLCLERVKRDTERSPVAPSRVTSEMNGLWNHG